MPRPTMFLTTPHAVVKAFFRSAGATQIPDDFGAVKASRSEWRRYPSPFPSESEVGHAAHSTQSRAAEPDPRHGRLTILFRRSPSRIGFPFAPRSAGVGLPLCL